MMLIKKYVVKVKPTKSDSERLTCILGLPPTGLKCHALSKSDI